VSKKPGRGGGKKTLLTDEDHEVWEHTAQSLSPLKNPKGYVLDAYEGEEDFAQLFAPKIKAGHQGKKDHAPPAVPKPAVKKDTPELNAFDRRNVKKLKGRDGYRLRVGDWRVVYDIEAGKLVLIVIEIGPRGDIYD
jgi:mRNA-degrading endonuclease RelE of RelBE toxin-antitoxin system